MISSGLSTDNRTLSTVNRNDKLSISILIYRI